MPIYKDFIGLNVCIYDPSHDDLGSYGSGSNTLGYNPAQSGISPIYWYTSSVGYGNVSALTKPPAARTLVLLNLHRNGPWGYGSWKQIRASNNHLSRYQRRNNIFTYVQEPGEAYSVSINDTTQFHIDRYGEIKQFFEPVVVDSYKPLSLVAEMAVPNPETAMSTLKSVEIKSSFGNETVFFANNEANQYYNTIEQTDDNYEELTGLYLFNGLEDDSSPIEVFNLLNYKQTVFPKMQYAFLNKTRSRTHFKSIYWLSNRVDRTETEAANGYGKTVPSQSIWPLDVASDWSTRKEPLARYMGYSSYTVPFYNGGCKGQNFFGINLGAFNTGEDTGFPATSSLTASDGASGILMNTYSHIGRGWWSDTGGTQKVNSSTANFSDDNLNQYLTASCFYSRLHTLTPQASLVAPSGIDIKEINRKELIGTGSMFQGLATWDAPKQAGVEPFYNSYADFAEETRVKGQGYSTVPEFRISNHVAFYNKKGPLEETADVFELSGATSADTTSANDPTFYKILSTSDFMKHFDLIVNDHKDFTEPSIITMRCKAVKKFLPYKGFYPADRCVELSQQFYNSYSKYTTVSQFSASSATASLDFAFQALNEPLFAPGVLFNTIKAGVACDYPVISLKDTPGIADFTETGDPSATGWKMNVMTTGSALEASSSIYYDSAFSDRIPFEALIQPIRYLGRKQLTLQEPHPWGFGGYGLTAKWDGSGDTLYTKMANNFLAEVPEFFLKDQNFTTISSLESSNPSFGNAKSGSFYTMRISMYRSKNQTNDTLEGKDDIPVTPPQDLYQRIGLRETLTMYSRPSAFGPPMWGGGEGEFDHGGTTYGFSGSDSLAGFNFPYTPPYYHGDAWCDLVFECKETKKYTVTEVLNEVQQYPYYSRFWWPGENDAYRDLSAYFQRKYYPKYRGPYRNYTSSSWFNLMGKPSPAVIGGGSNPDWVNGYREGPRILRTDNTCGMQHPSVLNFNAMQIKSSVNLFGKAIQRTSQLESDGTSDRVEVFTEATNEAKTRWVIQPKFETPILNFNKYSDLSENNCTSPAFATESVPRGMWHQYGDIPSEQEGVYLEANDIPPDWLRGCLAVPEKTIKASVKSLADLCGFNTEPKKLGKLAPIKEISECVVAVPFVQRNNIREFFTIPREDIDDTVSALRREVEPNVFILGGPPKVGNTIIHLVKMMKKYVFPPAMDFVEYPDIQPFAMYVFEFKHSLSSTDLQNIWQNLPPQIGTSIAESEAVISHELLASELLGGGSVIKNGKLDENARGPGVPSDIQWMMFKVKKRAKTKYLNKVIQNTGHWPTPALIQAMQRGAEKEKTEQGIDTDITYNWPYDFFSLVELVKLDAEITFSDIENDDKGEKIIKSIKKDSPDQKREKKAFIGQTDMAIGKKNK